MRTIATKMPTISALVGTVLSVIATLWGRQAWAAPSGDYQPYQPPAAAESVSAPLYVVLAYSAIWLVLLLFVASVWRRQRRVEVEIEQMRHQLETRTGER
jgi:CcmD family protein